MVVSIVITILVMGCAPHLSPPHAGHGVTDPGALDYAMDLLTLPPPPLPPYMQGTDPGALDYAMNRAIDAYYNDRAWFHSLQKRVMQQDWSWSRPAMDYIDLYFSACKS